MFYTLKAPLLLPLILSPFLYRKVAAEIADAAAAVCRTDVTQFSWHELDEETKRYFQWDGWDGKRWDNIDGGLRWYYTAEWEHLWDYEREGLGKLGWTEDAWNRRDGDDNPSCIYERPLAELRPWSRLLPEEREAAFFLGFDQDTWHTKEFDMIAWQPEDGPKSLDAIVREPAVKLPDNGFLPIKLKLDIPELYELVSWDALAALDQMVFVDDLGTKLAENRAFGNDEWGGYRFMSTREFVDGIRSGEKYYMKYEDDKQDDITNIFGGIDPGDILKRYLENTTVGEISRIGPKFAGERLLEVTQLYVGGNHSSTQMHLDLQSFNFLYVVSGRKRIRLLPNDQRYAKQFSWGLEVQFSVWPGFDLLNGPLPPGGVEMIIGPGEGVMIPYHTWHAVENLEPTIAFGYIRDFPGTESPKNCSHPNPNPS